MDATPRCCAACDGTRVLLSHHRVNTTETLEHPVKAYRRVLTDTIISMESSTPNDPISSGSQINITVIGGGYVGLPTAAVLAKFGHVVTLAENDLRRLRSLREGRSPHFEEGLEALMNEGVLRGNLKFIMEASVAVDNAEIIFICVPTPQGDDGTTDMSYLMRVVASIAPNLGAEAIVVIKSTVPVGTAQRVYDVIGRSDVSVVSNPEFLSTGTAVAESLHPERIVVGAKDSRVAMRVASLFEESKAPVVVTSNATAETIKYAANAFLAVRLSFSNELSRFCEQVDANVIDLLQGLGHDHRIGFSYLQPGPGWGGSCLPKDTAALIVMGKANNFDFPVLQSAVATNNAQLEHVVQTILSKVGDTAGRVVGLWGLTFKAGTDDRRNSPALHVAKRLLESGITLKAYDPTVALGGADDLDGIEIVSDAYSAAKGASLVVLLTEWPEFRELDWDKVAGLMAKTSIFDTRNALNRDVMRNSSLHYSSIGTV
jgi:UDPglucose 6-dehydrogenase